MIGVRHLAPLLAALIAAPAAAQQPPAPGQVATSAPPAAPR